MRSLRLILIASLLLTIMLFSLSNSSSSYTLKSVRLSGSFIGACSGTAASGSTVCQDVNQQTSKNNVFVSIIKTVINFISVLVGIASVIIVVISGFKFVASGGDAKKVEEAKKSLVGVVIGIVVVILAQTIVIFVLDKVK